MTADEPATEPVDDGYPGSARLAAGLAALFVPAISLVVALVLRSGERRPRRRSQPATWALAAGGVMPAQLLLAVILASAASFVGRKRPDGDGGLPVRRLRHRHAALPVAPTCARAPPR